MPDIVSKARAFAVAAHAAVGQTRKYTGEPYWTHPASVAAIVAAVDHTDHMLAAAWLHDVVEDTGVSIDFIEDEFGWPIASLVSDLTNAHADPAIGNRAHRFTLELGRIAQISPDAKTIKLADLIDNTGSIVDRDPKFAAAYMDEKRLLLPALVGGNPALHLRASEIVDAYFV